MPQVGQLRWTPASQPSKYYAEAELEEIEESATDYMHEAAVSSHLEKAMQSMSSSGGHGVTPFQNGVKILEQLAGADTDDAAELEEAYGSGEMGLPQPAVLEYLNRTGLWHEVHTAAESDEESSDESRSDEPQERKEEREKVEEFEDPLHVQDATALECTSDATPPSDCTAVLIEQLCRRPTGTTEAAVFAPLFQRSRHPELRPAYRLQRLSQNVERCSPSSPSLSSTYPRSCALRGAQMRQHARQAQSKMLGNSVLESLYAEAGAVTSCPLQAIQPRSLCNRRPRLCSDAAAVSCTPQSAAAAAEAAEGATAAAATAADDATAERADEFLERLPEPDTRDAISEAGLSEAAGQVSLATPRDAELSDSVGEVCVQAAAADEVPWHDQPPRPTAETHRWLPRHTAEALLDSGTITDGALVFSTEQSNTYRPASSAEVDGIDPESQEAASVPPQVEVGADFVAASSPWPHEPALATPRRVVEVPSEAGSADEKTSAAIQEPALATQRRVVEVPSEAGSADENTSAAIQELLEEQATARSFTTEEEDDGLFSDTFPNATAHVFGVEWFLKDPASGHGNRSREEEEEVRILTAKIDACKAAQAPLRDRGTILLKCLHYARVAGSVAQKQAASVPEVLASLAEDRVQQAQAVAEMRTALEDAWKTEAEAVAESQCLLERLKASRTRCEFLSRQIKEATAAIEKIEEQETDQCDLLRKRVDSQGSLAEGHSSNCEAAADETFSQPEPEPFRSPPVRPQDAPSKDGMIFPVLPEDQLSQAAWVLPAAAVPAFIPPPPPPPNYPAPDRFAKQAPAAPLSPERSDNPEAEAPAVPERSDTFLEQKMRSPPMNPLAWLDAGIDEDEKECCASASALAAAPAADGGGSANDGSRSSSKECSAPCLQSQSIQSAAASLAALAADGGGSANDGSSSIISGKECSESRSRSQSTQSVPASAAAPVADGGGSESDASSSSSSGGSGGGSAGRGGSSSSSGGRGVKSELTLESDSAPSTTRSSRRPEQDKSPDSAGNSECSEWSVPGSGLHDEGDAQHIREATLPARTSRSRSKRARASRNRQLQQLRVEDPSARKKAPSRRDANEEMHNTADNSEFSDWSVSPTHQEKAREVETQAWNVLNEVHEGQGRTCRTASRARALRSRERAPRQPRVEESLTKKAVPRSSRRLPACSQRPKGEARGAGATDSMGTFLGARQRAASDPTQALHTAWSLHSSPGGAHSLQKLSVGAKVGGTVTRSTWLGAFVDVGAEMDGLVGVEDMQRSGLRLSVGSCVKGLIIREVDLKSSRLLLSAKRAQIV